MRMEYFAPKTLPESIAMMKKWNKKAKLISGGTNVIPDLRAKNIQPQILIDLSGVKNLSYIKEERRTIKIGALTTISDLASSKIIKNYAPVLSEAANQLGNPLVRNKATIAGNLVHASPAADMAVPLLALEASVVLNRDSNSREIPIDRLFVSPNRTVLKPDELIKEIIFLKPNSSTRMAYHKLGLRNAMAISVVSIAILTEMAGDVCKKVRIGLGAAAPRPIRAYKVEELLEGQRVTEELTETCCERVKKEVNPITDIRASAEYRRSMASVLLKRLIQQVAIREKG